MEAPDDENELKMRKKDHDHTVSYIKVNRFTDMVKVCIIYV